MTQHVHTKFVDSDRPSVSQDTNKARTCLRLSFPHLAILMLMLALVLLLLLLLCLCPRVAPSSPSAQRPSVRQSRAVAARGSFCRAPVQRERACGSHCVQRLTTSISRTMNARLSSEVWQQHDQPTTQSHELKITVRLPEDSRRRSKAGGGGKPVKPTKTD